MYKKSISELLTAVSKLKSRNDKINMLRDEHSLVLENLVDLCFNPNIKFLLPEGEPPYKAATKAQGFEMTLYANMRKFGIFVENGPYPTMSTHKREIQFVEFLETLDPDDANLVIAIKDKKMPYKGITRKLFEEAWPALASTWIEKEKANG
jgi:hypothetical protein|tara:strand:+ start:1945 stop:2397 length:453 start_codon:yes stop_codon:yes gene_type:complete